MGKRSFNFNSDWVKIFVDTRRPSRSFSAPKWPDNGKDKVALLQESIDRVAKIDSIGDMVDVSLNRVRAVARDQAIYHSPGDGRRICSTVGNKNLRTICHRAIVTHRGPEA